MWIECLLRFTWFLFLENPILFDGLSLLHFLFCFLEIDVKKCQKKKKIFFQVLFTTTRFSSVLSCEDLLISKCPMSYNQTVFVSLTIKADIATIQLQRDMFLALSAFNSKTI